MQETFAREAAADPEPFTGERLTASVHGQVEIEHYHRYLFARAFCRDRDILDVASGEGYGTAQLAQVARHAVGVEFSGATVVNAAANFPRPNLRFVRADARMLPLETASFDVVTSFETIEHFDRQEEFVREVRRVLRADGCFIVSTPDRDIYSPPGASQNPFHVREFDREEYLDLLHRHFRYVTLIRQRPMLVSGLFPEQPAALSPLLFERVAEPTFASDAVLPKAPYLIAIASQHAPIPAPVSLLIERSDIDNVRFAEAEAELNQLRTSEAMARTEREEAIAAVEAERANARAIVEAERLAARDAVEQARKAAEQADSDAKSTAAKLRLTAAERDQARLELNQLGGSLRRFLPQYLPRLMRHLFR